MILKNNNGVTLIELMIVLVIAAILVGGIYTLFTTQQRSYFVQDRVAGIQQDARAALDIMARDIRIAAFRTGRGSDTGFNGISINGSINFAIVPVNGGSSASDQITLVLAGDALARVTSVNIGNKQVTLNGLGGLNVNDYVAFEGLNNVYVIESINDTDPLAPIITLTNSTVTPRSTLPPPEHLSNFGGGVAGAGARIYPIGIITYNISGDSLQRDGQPLAGDGATTVVEDLQFAYQVEGVDYWTFDGQTTGAETNDTVLPGGSSNADIRLVRINIIVRTAVPDPEETGFSKPVCEDRQADTSNPGCRRRVYTTVVKVRNL